MRPLSGMLPWPEVGARKQVGDGPAGQREDGAPAEEGRAAEEPTWLWGQVSRAELSTVAGPVPGSPSVSGPESWRGGSFRKICLSCCAGERGGPLGGLQRAGGSPVRMRSLTPQFAFAFPVKYSSGLRLEMTFPMKPWQCWSQWAASLSQVLPRAWQATITNSCMLPPSPWALSTRPSQAGRCRPCSCKMMVLMVGSEGLLSPRRRAGGAAACGGSGGGLGFGAGM